MRREEGTPFTNEEFSVPPYGVIYREGAHFRGVELNWCGYLSLSEGVSLWYLII